MTIFEQLVKATNKRQQAEADQDYLKALAIETTKLPDPEFFALPKEAQQWQNEAAAAVNKNKPIPEPDGFKGKIGTSSSRLSSAAPNIANTPKAIPVVKKNTRKPSGVVDAIRRAIILHPDWTNRHIQEFLHANGNPEAKLETINVNAGDIRHTIIMARELGFWNDAQYAQIGEPADAGTSVRPETENEVKEEAKEGVKA